MLVDDDTWFQCKVCGGWAVIEVDALRKDGKSFQIACSGCGKHDVHDFREWVWVKN